MSVCRVFRRGGGVAALFKDVYECKQVSFGNYTSFAYPGIVLKGDPHILLTSLQNTFQPTELLSKMSLEFDCFTIAGDFNIHR